MGLAAVRLASRLVRVCSLHDRSFVFHPDPSELVMTVAEVTSKRDKAADDLDRDAPSRPPESRTATKRSMGIRPFLITLAAVALAGLLGWRLWGVYMGEPWTRDATVRAYVVTMAPEVAGRIVELPVRDNQFVHKGDLLMVIDPTNFKIAVSLNEATVQQAQAKMWNTARESQRRQALSNLAVTTEEKETFASNAVSTHAQYQQALANLQQAKVNLERTEIRSPVNGWVTNLLAQRGDYVNVGQNQISIVDGDSFWIDGYFEELNIEPIHVGDSAQVKLMGYSEAVRGHVDSVARAINVANAQPNGQGVAT